MKTRRTTICTNYPMETSHVDMTEIEIDSFVKQCQNNLRESFKWDFYPASYKHLVVCVRYDGNSCNIYSQGYLMDEEEFERKIANRKDLNIERALVYHRGTSKF